MPEPIIRVENLGKRYLIRHQAGGARYHALRDVLANGLKTGFGLFGGRNGRPSREEFWALKDVNFEVNEGEVVGIIGRNGAGKSTLLKILSRITEPTTGRVTLNGRVASLLEVGTGFHPELTGRENIYLNGSILGMGRTEIARKFDEIVAFAEVERFLDTPVKRYSSGMYVRLAFAVAAHLEPEILVVDEVLAVGDAEFQKKCLGKMGEVARGGRTVLFVSHNLGTILALCPTVAWLAGGRVEQIGSCSEVIQRYTNQFEEVQASATVRDDQHLRGTRAAHITRTTLYGTSGESKAEFLIGETIVAEFEYHGEPGVRGTGWILVNSADGIHICAGFMRDLGPPIELGGTGSLRVRLAGLDLHPGRYSITAGLFSHNNEIMDWCEMVIHFEVLRHFTDGRAFDQRLGLFSRPFEWHFESRGEMSAHSPS